MPPIVKGKRRYRYIGFHIDYANLNHSFTSTELRQALQYHTQMLFSKNMKDMGVWIIQFNGTTGILKFDYREKDHAMILLKSIEKIGTHPVMITTHATSGTIRGLTHNNKIVSSSL